MRLGVSVSLRLFSTTVKSFTTFRRLSWIRKTKESLLYFDQIRLYCRHSERFALRHFADERVDMLRNQEIGCEIIFGAPTTLAFKR